MTIVPVILDSRPRYLEQGGARATLLSLPMGTGTFLDLVASALAGIEADAPRIVPLCDVSGDYERLVRRHAGDRASVVPPDDVPAWLERQEPADQLLLIDPRFWPVDGLDLDAILECTRHERCAAHAVAVASSVDCARESVRCDELGRVRHVRRYYDRVTRPSTGQIPYSLIPMAALENVEPAALTDLRSVLASEGVLSRDVALCGGIADLRQLRALLALAERVVTEVLADRVPEGYAEFAPEVLVGRGVRIHQTARVLGPAILQHGVAVEAHATLIGPAVIGEGCSLRKNCVVAQSVIATGVEIASNVTVRHGVRVTNSLARGRNRFPSDSATPCESMAFLAQRQAVGFDVQPSSPVAEGRWLYQTLKRCLDVTASLGGLLLLAPWMLIVAMLIRLESKGGAFYGQEREGRRGRNFRCWKFRTMCSGAHVQQRALKEANGVDGPQFKMPVDPRVTRVGRWLRTTNIDELPQLFNVLIGNMSLVGPRPSPFRENQICVPWRRARLSVRPGITGLWQICRHHRSEGDFHQWIAFDTLYVRHLSFLLDCKILLATLFTLGGKWSVPLSWIIPLPDESPEPSFAEAAARTV